MLTCAVWFSTRQCIRSKKKFTIHALDEERAFICLVVRGAWLEKGEHKKIWLSAPLNDPFYRFFLFQQFQDGTEPILEALVTPLPAYHCRRGIVHWPFRARSFHSLGAILLSVPGLQQDSSLAASMSTPSFNYLYHTRQSVRFFLSSPQTTVSLSSTLSLDTQSLPNP